MKSVRGCLFRCERDVETLVCTRGRAFPLTLLRERLRWPRCGSREVAVVFDPPSVTGEGYSPITHQEGHGECRCQRSCRLAESAGKGVSACRRAAMRPAGGGRSRLKKKQLNQRGQRQPFGFPASVRLGSSEAAPSGFLLPGFSSWSAVPIAAMPPATIAAEAAFLATRLSFDGILEDDFFFGFDDVLGFLDLAVFDLGPARREEGLTLARLAVFFMRSSNDVRGLQSRPYIILRSTRTRWQFVSIWPMPKSRSASATTSPRTARALFRIVQARTGRERVETSRCNCYYRTSTVGSVPRKSAHSAGWSNRNPEAVSCTTTEHFGQATDAIPE